MAAPPFVQGRRAETSVASPATSRRAPVHPEEKQRGRWAPRVAGPRRRVEFQAGQLANLAQGKKSPLACRFRAFSPELCIIGKRFNCRNYANTGRIGQRRQGCSTTAVLSPTSKSNYASQGDEPF